MACDFDPAGNDAGVPIDTADMLVQLQFDCRSLRFDAVLHRGKEQSSNLTVTSDLGLMPYSAEGRQRRIDIFAILRAARGGYPIRIELTRRQRLYLSARATLPNPVTATAAVTGVTALLVQARPYIDMIQMRQPDSISVRPRQ